MACTVQIIIIFIIFHCIYTRLIEYNIVFYTYKFSPTRDVLIDPVILLQGHVYLVRTGKTVFIVMY